MDNKAIEVVELGTIMDTPAIQSRIQSKAANLILGAALMFQKGDISAEALVTIGTDAYQDCAMQMYDSLKARINKIE